MTLLPGFYRVSINVVMCFFLTVKREGGRAGGGVGGNGATFAHRAFDFIYSQREKRETKKKQTKIIKKKTIADL